MSSRFRGATGGVLLMGCYWWGATGGALTGGVLLVGNGTRTRFGVAPLLDTSSSRMPLHA